MASERPRRDFSWIILFLCWSLTVALRYRRAGRTSPSVINVVFHISSHSCSSSLTVCPPGCVLATSLLISIQRGTGEWRFTHSVIAPCFIVGRKILITMETALPNKELGCVFSRHWSLVYYGFLPQWCLLLSDPVWQSNTLFSVGFQSFFFFLEISMHV